MTWELNEVKNNLDLILDLAAAKGVQIIRKDNKEMAVIISVEDYRKLTNTNNSIVAFFSNSPLAGADLDLERK